MSNALLDFVEKSYTGNITMMKAKNADYGGDDDPLFNFRLAEMFGICSMEQAVMVRLCDKFARSINLLRRPAAVKGESFGDTCDDGSNYFQIVKYIRRCRADGTLWTPEALARITGMLEAA